MWSISFCLNIDMQWRGRIFDICGDSGNSARLNIPKTLNRLSQPLLLLPYNHTLTLALLADSGRPNQRHPKCISPPSSRPSSSCSYQWHQPNSNSSNKCSAAAGININNPNPKTCPQMLRGTSNNTKTVEHSPQTSHPSPYLAPLVISLTLGQRTATNTSAPTPSPACTSRTTARALFPAWKTRWSLGMGVWLV